MPLQIVRNDITKMKCDAIVNAANETLLGGGGVDGAIHRAAGEKLLEECKKLNGCSVGEAKITKGYKLPSKYVIHTVGPIWRGGDYGERELLISCYKKSLELAKSKGLESIAFPLISAGVYGYPMEEAFDIASSTIAEFLMKNEMLVYIVVFGENSLAVSKKHFSDIKQYIDDNYVESYDFGRDRRSQNIPYPQASVPMPSQQQSEPCYNSMPVDAYEVVEECNAPLYEAPVIMSEKREEPKKSKFKLPLGRKQSEIAFDTMLDESFSEMLLRKIDESGMTDSQCYKLANVDRKLFSKIRTNSSYRPSKQTVIAFCIALKLDLAETNEMLLKAGFALSQSFMFDVIVKYFIENGYYDIFKINEVLFEYDQKLLG